MCTKGQDWEDEKYCAVHCQRRWVLVLWPQLFCRHRCYLDAPAKNIFCRQCYVLS
jgi:hypothetical protein